MSNINSSSSNIQQRGKLSAAVKVLKKYKSKIVSIIKKYAPKWATGNAISDVFDEVLDGIVSISDSVDELVYN